MNVLQQKRKQLIKEKSEDGERGRCVKNKSQDWN